MMVFKFETGCTYKKKKTKIYVFIYLTFKYYCDFGQLFVMTRQTWRNNTVWHETKYTEIGKHDHLGPSLTTPPLTV